MSVTDRTPGTGPLPTPAAPPEPADGGARPVTPVGIAGALVADAADAADGVAPHGIPDGATPCAAGLDRAARILTGLDGYCSAMTTPAGPELAALARLTTDRPWHDHGGVVHLEQEMLSGHVEGALLALLARLAGARHVLEIGMFTGYASLAMAQALPEDGEVVACELDPGVADLARRAFAASAAGGRIRIEVGPAARTLARLADDGERFDLVFLDADKTGYPDYVRTLLDRDLLRVGGLLVVDNTLHQGEPWAADVPSANARAVDALNRWMLQDPRLTPVLLPVRDGVTLALREPDPSGGAAR